MRTVGQAAFPALLTIAAFVAACGPNVPPQTVSWRPNESIITPESTAVAPVGGLRVETDTDLVQNGGQTYYNVLRQQKRARQFAVSTRPRDDRDRR
jgi:hypothetical protein